MKQREVVNDRVALGDGDVVGGPAAGEVNRDLVHEFAVARHHARAFHVRHIVGHAVVVGEDAPDGRGSRRHRTARGDPVHLAAVAAVDAVHLQFQRWRGGHGRRRRAGRPEAGGERQRQQEQKSI